MTGLLLCWAALVFIVAMSPWHRYTMGAAVISSAMIAVAAIWLHTPVVSAIAGIATLSSAAVGRRVFEWVANHHMGYRAGHLLIALTIANAAAVSIAITTNYLLVFLTAALTAIVAYGLIIVRERTPSAYRAVTVLISTTALMLAVFMVALIRVSLQPVTQWNEIPVAYTWLVVAGVLVLFGASPSWWHLTRHRVAPEITGSIACTFAIGLAYVLSSRLSAGTPTETTWTILLVAAIAAIIYLMWIGNLHPAAATYTLLLGIVAASIVSTPTMAVTAMAIVCGLMIIYHAMLGHLRMRIGSTEILLTRAKKMMPKLALWVFRSIPAIAVLVVLALGDTSGTSTLTFVALAILGAAMVTGRTITGTLVSV